MRLPSSRVVRSISMTVLLLAGVAGRMSAQAVVKADSVAQTNCRPPAKSCTLLPQLCDTDVDALVDQTACDLIACTLALRANDPAAACSVPRRMVLARFEHALRLQAQAIQDAEDAAAKAAPNKKTTDKIAGRTVAADTEPAPDAAAIADKQTLRQIKTVVHVSNQGLFIPATSYDDIFFRLNTGYEFVTVDKFFSQGSPRISLLINSQLGGHQITEDLNGPRLDYGGRLTFAAALESSKEVTVVLPGQTPAAANAARATGKAASDTTTPDKKAFGFELQGTWIFYRSPFLRPNSLQNYLGFIVAGGGLKTDVNTQTIGRIYGGLRWAKNPEVYSDFLYGKTSNLKSRRLEVRGQFPALALDNGDRVYLGGIGNFGIDRKKNGTGAVDSTGQPVGVERDVVLIYVSWATDLRHLFGNGNGNGKSGS